MAGDNGLVTPVTVDGVPVGTVFGAGQRAFYFLLDDERDVPRGPFDDADSASLACEHQARCLALADRWEMMVDT